MVFLLVNGFYWGVASANGFPYLHPHTWAHFDSFRYMQIARVGYIHSCPGHPQVVPMDFCNDWGWFPGYSAFLWPLIHAGMSPVGAGVLVDMVFEFAVLAFLWITFLHARPSVRNVLVLGMAAFFFGQIYYRAIFPISQELFFSLLLVFFVARRKWYAAGLAGTAAALTYSTGFLWAPVAGLWILVASRGASWLERLRRVAITSGLTAAGFAYVLWIQKLIELISVRMDGDYMTRRPSEQVEAQGFQIQERDRFRWGGIVERLRARKPA